MVYLPNLYSVDELIPEKFNHETLVGFDTNIFWYNAAVIPNRKPT